MKGWRQVALFLFADSLPSRQTRRVALVVGRGVGRTDGFADVEPLSGLVLHICKKTSSSSPYRAGQAPNAQASSETQSCLPLLGLYPALLSLEPSDLCRHPAARPPSRSSSPCPTSRTLYDDVLKSRVPPLTAVTSGRSSSSSSSTRTSASSFSTTSFQLQPSLFSRRIPPLTTQPEQRPRVRRCQTNPNEPTKSHVFGSHLISTFPTVPPLGVPPWEVLFNPTPSPSPPARRSCPSPFVHDQPRDTHSDGVVSGGQSLTVTSLVAQRRLTDIHHRTEHP